MQKSAECLFHDHAGPIAPETFQQEKAMRTDSKLAALNGSPLRTPLHDALETLRRALTSRSDRRIARQLRDIDGWSDQSEVAFLEELQGRRA
jgi:hypothetical protein